MQQQVILLEPVSEHACTPIRATALSACYDVYSDLVQRKVTAFDEHNNKYIIDSTDSLTIPPMHRIIIPTGFKMQCPADMSINFYARSGLGVKHGLVLANQVGIIDADYPEETGIPLINMSQETQTIGHAERLCQMRLEHVLPTKLGIVDKLPEIDSERTSGFGHSGKH